MAPHLQLHLLPAGAIREPEDAIQALERLAELLDAYAVLAELRLPPPGLQALDASRLLEAVAQFLRDQKPCAWDSEIHENVGGLARSLLEAAEVMQDTPEDVVGLYAKTLLAFLRDLPDAVRAR